jgi:hypothetical protein
MKMADYANANPPYVLSTSSWNKRPAAGAPLCAARLRPESRSRRLGLPPEIDAHDVALTSDDAIARPHGRLVY